MKGIRSTALSKTIRDPDRYDSDAVKAYYKKIRQLPLASVGSQVATGLVFACLAFVWVYITKVAFDNVMEQLTALLGAPAASWVVLAYVVVVGLYFFFAITAFGFGGAPVIYHRVVRGEFLVALWCSVLVYGLYAVGRPYLHQDLGEFLSPMLAVIWLLPVMLYVVPVMVVYGAHASAQKEVVSLAGQLEPDTDET